MKLGLHPGRCLLSAAVAGVRQDVPVTVAAAESPVRSTAVPRYGRPPDHLVEVPHGVPGGARCRATAPVRTSAHGHRREPRAPRSFPTAAGPPDDGSCRALPAHLGTSVRDVQRRTTMRGSGPQVHATRENLQALSSNSIRRQAPHPWRPSRKNRRNAETVVRHSETGIPSSLTVQRGLTTVHGSQGSNLPAGSPKTTIEFWTQTSSPSGGVANKK